MTCTGLNVGNTDDKYVEVARFNLVSSSEFTSINVYIHDIVFENPDKTFTIISNKYNSEIINKTTISRSGTHWESELPSIVTTPTPCGQLQGDFNGDGYFSILDAYALQTGKLVYNKLCDASDLSMSNYERFIYYKNALFYKIPLIETSYSCNDDFTTSIQVKLVQRPDLDSRSSQLFTTI